MSALDKQEGGSHYKDMKIQPAEYCEANGLSYLESIVVKYVSRHRNKNGKDDLKKAIHSIELLMQLVYPDKDPLTGEVVGKAGSGS